MKLLISHQHGADLCFLYDGNVLTEVFRADHGPESFSCDDIVVGRVLNTVPGLHAAFVLLTHELKDMEPLGGAAYLPFSELPEGTKELKSGDLVPVQIVSLPAGTKPIRLSGKLSLSGKYSAVGENIRGVQASRKLSKDASRKLKDIVSAEAERSSFTEAGNRSDAGLGVIIRTNAEDVLSQGENTSADLIKEIRDLAQNIIEMRKKAPFLTCGSFLYHGDSQLKSVLRDRNPEEVILDRPTTLFKETVEQAGKLSAEYSIHVRTYDEENSSFFVVSGLSGKFDEALRKKVWLKSGAMIFIERTEALVAIDVNSGKNEASLKKKANAAEEFRHKVNMEAADEIFRQIRLRNLSGMILIDFINVSDEHLKELEKKIRQLCIKDPLPTDFIDFTGLGLAEITRRKTGKTLSDLVKTLDNP